MQKRELSNYIGTKLLTTCFYLVYSFFEKQKEVRNYSLCLIFCMIFEENYFSCYTLITDQISLSGCLYYVIHWTICLLLLFDNQPLLSKILKLTSFESSCFLYMSKKARQKFKYLENDKSF